MGHHWSLYAPVKISAAEQAVDAMYETLSDIVGDDLAEHLEPGEELAPSELGLWPDVSVPLSPHIPTAEEERRSLSDPNKVGVRFEEAALERLATCTAHVRIDRPRDLDPALVSALRALIAKLGPCVFTEAHGFELTTSETLLATLAKLPDLTTALRAVVAAETEDEDFTDEAEEEEEDEPVPDSARPEVLRMVLGEIAQRPAARRKVSELLGAAPKVVGAVAERLARIGAEPDSAIAKALGITEPEALAARVALATIFRRAERR
jgi:hypothetical protein